MTTPPGGHLVTVVGVTADGVLHGAAEEHVRCADVLLGGRRHLDLVAPVPGQDRRPWPSPLLPGLPGLLDELRGRRVVALASGDPMVSGIGSTLVRALGPDAVRVVPAVSSVALARARMRWSAEESAVVTVVGRHEARVLREIAPGRRILVLTSGSQTPAIVGELLTETGHPDAVITLLADLGSDAESSTTKAASEWAETPAEDVPPLHVLAIDVPVDTVPPSWSSWAAGLPDDAFENDGQLTKRDLRASALARLSPSPGQHLWDVGAGAGSVGIEWMRAHPTCRTTAVEADCERAARITRNAARLGVPDLRVVEGRAPDALDGLDAPDAVFIGGGATRPGVLDACLAALRPGGRLVVHGVTLETESLLAHAYRTHGGELTRLAVETTHPVGTFTGWTPLRTVTQWSVRR
ncbi:precorrin-6y C5,15-methyltransferase (decarboxylating) subunit CbiE [Nocardioides sp. Y6]|uniref:Precorrin-6y C5,15-methyltransferase (Decarboxylating) subunit CbiE n=1 Tax=Nocardioides malaquae TaxID=2773426 RepID=A0ABR9RX60_9ACTN|nr:precorrin-6y C5,15-methyltransferase (decarboxylating) subunit CbiE [Nocardioides malaquae]MBE7325757.1 precorrin-6y C5,15-methyltransferase (decarboxylating) subunit CbiE [Nocardioides malaquae]